MQKPCTSGAKNRPRHSGEADDLLTEVGLGSEDHGEKHEHQAGFRMDRSGRAGIRGVGKAAGGDEKDRYLERTTICHAHSLPVTGFRKGKSRMWLASGLLLLS